MELLGEDILHENYGCTETGMVTHLSPEMQRKKIGSSGYPYKGVHIKIKSDDGCELSSGSIGRIWVHTPVAVTGYINAPDLGAEAIDSERFFATGDAGYLDADGFLYITGRSVDMIISGGVNIYPVEIEAALQEHGAVNEAAVIGVPHEDFGEALLAICEIIEGRTAPSPEELSAFVRQRLASYKVPKQFHFVNELPRNSLGKVLKTVLREPFWRQMERAV
jgi:long-chain acyl-CoA synthetase